MQTKIFSTEDIKDLKVDAIARKHRCSSDYAASRKIRTIAGRLIQELGRKLPNNHNYSDSLDLFTRVLNQKRSDKNKIYSLHEPGVHCISEGKEHKKYEFGNKVSILYTQNTGVTVGALSFNNQYDGYTLPDTLE